MLSEQILNQFLLFFFLAISRPTFKAEIISSIAALLAGLESKDKSAEFLRSSIILLTIFPISLTWF